MRWAAAVAVAVVALVAATSARAEAPGQWSGGGPPAGVVNLLSVDPVDPQIVYGSAFATVYRSRDGAASWESLPLQPAMPNPVGTLAVDPAAHERVYAQAGTDLFLSTNFGEAWTPLSGVQFVGAFALLPGRPVGLLAATFESGLQRSDDGGATWKDSSEGLADPNSVYSLSVAPSDPRIVYALAGVSLYRSTNGGRSWTQVGLPAGVDFIPLLVVDPSSPDTLYASAANTVFRSTDGGLSWAERNGGLDLGEESFVTALAAADAQPTKLYLLTDRALWRSTDGGGEWRLVNDDPFNQIGPWSIGVDPLDPDHLYRASGTGVFVSTDGGVTFAPASTGLPGLAVQAVAAGPGAVHASLYAGGIVSSSDGGVTWRPGTGDEIEFESLQALAADPNGERVYAGSYTGRFFRSDDGGENWNAMGLHLPHSTIWSLAPDPGTPDRVLAATEVGVYRSGNGGEEWRRSSRGLPNTGVRALAFSVSAPNVVYAGLDRRGLYRSGNGGRTWRRASLGRLTVLSLAVDPRAPNVVYAATRLHGAYRSDDGGRTWARLAATRLTGSVVLDPAAPDTVLLASGSRVLRSTARGAALTPYDQGLPFLGGTPIDPEAGVARTVVSIAAVPGGAYAATWAGTFGVTFS